MSHPPQGPHDGEGSSEWQGSKGQGSSEWQGSSDWQGAEWQGGQGEPGPAHGGWTGQPYGAGAYGTSQTSGRATTSLVLGIASLVLCCLGPLLGVPAIIVGVGARREIARSEGRTSGDGLALGGIISGILGSLLGIAVWATLVALFAFGASFDEVTVQDPVSCDEAAQDADPFNDCT